MVPSQDKSLSNRLATRPIVALRRRMDSELREMILVFPRRSTADGLLVINHLKSPLIMNDKLGRFWNVTGKAPDPVACGGNCLPHRDQASRIYNIFNCNMLYSKRAANHCFGRVCGLFFRHQTGLLLRNFEGQNQDFPDTIFLEIPIYLRVRYRERWE